MKAVVVREHGGYDKLLLEELPEPAPGACEVLVDVKTVSLNHLDAWVRRGVPGHAFPLPLVLGCDFAGVVRELGPGARGFAAGDRVVVLPGFSCGQCAACLSGADMLCRGYGIFGETKSGGACERIAVPVENLVKLPDGFGFVEAAATPLVFLTAWHMLVARAEVRPGEDVLVQAAGSGVSSAAIQIAKLLGARVIATAGSDAKAAKARELGADVVVNHRTQDVLETVRNVTGKRGVDVVIDHVGEATWEKSVRALARGGRLVTCGATTGPKAAIDLRVLFFKGLSLLGSTMGSKGELHTILPLVFAGKLRPVIAAVMKLDEVRRAHELLESREAFGKIVLEVAP